MADIHVVFNKAVNGGYKTYGALTTSDVVGWFEKHYSDRQDHFYNTALSNHHYNKHHSGESIERSSDKNKSQDIQTMKAIVNSKSLNRK